MDTDSVPVPSITLHRLPRGKAGERCTAPGGAEAVVSEAARSCLASAASWRREAVNLRELATGRHLTAGQANVLMREAQAADRLADEWAHGAEES